MQFLREYGIYPEMIETGAIDPDALRAVSHAFQGQPARRYMQAIRALPVRETALVRPDKGDPMLKSLHALGADVLISRAWSEPLTTGYLVPAKGWTIVLMPLRWRGSYVLNGREAEPGEVFVVGDENGYAGTGAGRDLLGVMIRNNRILPAIAALSGQSGRAVNLQDAKFLLNELNARRLWQTVLLILNGAQMRDRPSGTPHIPRFSEDLLIDRLASLLSEVLLDERRTGCGRQSDFEIAARAVQTLETCRKVPRLADMCQLCEVGKSGLYKSFMTVYGVSPARFLKLVRLHRIRDWLSDRDAPPRSVKDAVLSAGFGSGGRLAAEYAQHFGEKPSDTFARTLRARRG